MTTATAWGVRWSDGQIDTVRDEADARRRWAPFNDGRLQPVIRVVAVVRLVNNQWETTP